MSCMVLCCHRPWHIPSPAQTEFAVREQLRGFAQIPSAAQTEFAAAGVRECPSQHAATGRPTERQGTPQERPKLPNRQFSLSKRRPGSHIETQGAQEPARAPKPSIFTLKTTPWEPVRAQGVQKVARAPEPSILIIKTTPWEPFRIQEGHRNLPELPNWYQNDALGAISSPRAPRSPP